MSLEDNDDYDFSDFGDGEPDEAAMEEIRKEDFRIRNMPLVIKARQIFLVTEALVQTLNDSEIAEHYKEAMLQDSISIAAKISSAEGADLYTFRMENAVLVKVAARNLLTQASGLKMMGLVDERYLQVLRNEIEEFRFMFVEWVQSFDKSKDIQDNWGLFYED